MSSFGAVRTAPTRGRNRDTKITGLVLRVTPKNKKTFTLHTRGHRRESADHHRDVSRHFTEGRSRDRDEPSRRIRRGLDPREQARLAKAHAQAQSLTLTGLLDEIEPIFALTKSTWRAGSRFGRTKSEARSAIENVFSAAGKTPEQGAPAGPLEGGEGLQAEEAGEGKTSANGSAARALTYLRPVFDWASHRGRFRKRRWSRSAARIPGIRPHPRSFDR